MDHEAASRLFQGPTEVLGVRQGHHRRTPRRHAVGQPDIRSRKVAAGVLLAALHDRPGDPHLFKRTTV
eukprot:12835656-Alexandrium_andersonii.AAC.1